MFRQRTTWICLLIVFLLPGLIPGKLSDIRERRIIEGREPGATHFTATITGRFTDEVGGRRPVTRYWIRWRDQAGLTGQTLVPPDLPPRTTLELIRLPDSIHPSPDRQTVYYDPRYESSAFETQLLCVVLAAIVIAAAVLIIRLFRHLRTSSPESPSTPQ